MKEYIIKEGKKTFKMSELEANNVLDQIYSSARDTLVRTCHDIFLRVKSKNNEEGILLIKRMQNPAKGLLWPIGGGIKRGIPLEKSLKSLVKRECNLGIKGKLHLINSSRFFWRTNPFGTNKGVDDFALVFYALSKGQIKLNELHSDPIIVSKENYREIRKQLHPYINTSIDTIFKEYW